VAADTILVLDLTGNMVWSFKTDLGVFSSPALEDLNGDGMLEIIFGTNSAEVYVLDSEGNEIWKFDKLVGVFKSSPLAFDLDGDDVKEVYIGSDDGLYCINGDNGEMEWKYPTALEVSSSPAIGNIDGDDELELVFSSEDGVVYAVDWNGALVWALELDSGVVFSTPAIIDGKVILGTEEGKLIIIRDGKILNSYSTSSSIRGSVAVTEDYIVFGTYEEEILQQGSAKDSGNRIYALGSSGNLLWEFKTGGWGVFASPAIADIDRDEELEVVVGSREGRLYSIDLETGSEEWNYFDGSGILASPALVDIDRDGDLEIIVAYRLSNQIKLLDSPEKANLRISNILFSNDLAANNEIITATVIVENVGELAAEDFVVSVYKDFGDLYSVVGNGSIESLGPGEKISFDFNWTTQISSGELGAYATVDSYDEIDESNELDNNMVQRFKNDLVLSNVQFPALINPEEGEMSIKASLENIGRFNNSAELSVLLVNGSNRTILNSQDISFLSNQKKEVSINFDYLSNYTGLVLMLAVDSSSEDLNESNNYAEKAIIREEKETGKTSKGSTSLSVDMPIDNNQIITLVLVLVIVVII
jgi:outer membrane protein assembly factor BamB